MRDAFKLYEEIAAGVRDADGAWQFIRRFTATYATPTMPGDGCDDAELHAAEDRLGMALPVALRQMYTLIGRRDDLTRGQDVLLTPAQLHLDDSGKVLVFRRENQGVTQWGVHWRRWASRIRRWCSWWMGPLRRGGPGGCSSTGSRWPASK